MYRGSDMAIFGTLEEMPLPELLTMLGRRTGKLQLAKLPQEQNYKLYLDKAKLRAISVNNKILENESLARQAMIKLLSFEQGIFEFKRLPEDQLNGNLNIPIDKLLLQTTIVIDELKTQKERLPDAKTRFKRSGQVEIWVDDALYDFWQNCSSLLDKGCSAEEIATSLSLDTETVRYNLYKLRSLGKIAPVRAFKQSPVPPKQTPKQDLDLNKSIQDMSYREIIKWLQSNDSKSQGTLTKSKQPANQIESNKPPVYQPVHQKGLVNRLLKALSRRR